MGRVDGSLFREVEKQRLADRAAEEENLRRSMQGIGVRAAMARAEPVADDPTPTKPRSKKRAVSAGGGGGDRTPAKSFDPGDLNEEYALVTIGAGVMIVRERADGPIDDRIRLMSPGAFKLKLGNQFAGRKTIAEAWLTSPGRRDYDGVEFYPDPDGAAGTDGYLNLWHGFSVQPVQKAGGYSTFEDHMLANVWR